MIIHPGGLNAEEAFALLSTSLVPRPVGWTSTLSYDGVANLAPFSYTTVASTMPPMLLQAIEPADDGRVKDTLTNILDTGEFVVHVPLHDQMDDVQATASSVPPDVDEFWAAGIDRVPSAVVRASRIAQAPVAFECRLHTHLTPGLETVVIGRVVAVHIRDDLLPCGVSAGIPLGRLTALARVGSGFARLDDFDKSGARLSPDLA